jgi:hypothetical protein
MRFIRESRGFDVNRYGFRGEGYVPFSDVPMHYRAYSLGVMEEINDARNGMTVILGQDENIACGFDVEKAGVNNMGPHKNFELFKDEESLAPGTKETHKRDKIRQIKKKRRQKRH